MSQNSRSTDDTLADKCALITGSTSGIGLAIAHALASSGCNIGVNGLGDALEIKRLCHQIEQDYGVKVAYFDADLKLPIQIKVLLDKFFQQFGRVDILVNNAGIQHVASVTEFPTQMWDEIIAVNLTASFHTIKTCLPKMIEQGWGRVINIASVHGLVGSVDKSAYVAAKHGLVGLTKVVALETAEDGVTCNAVCPGYVHTEIIDRQINELSRSKKFVL